MARTGADLCRNEACSRSIRILPRPENDAGTTARREPARSVITRDRLLCQHLSAILIPEARRISCDTRRVTGIGRWRVGPYFSKDDSIVGCSIVEERLNRVKVVLGNTTGTWRSWCSVAVPEPDIRIVNRNMLHHAWRGVHVCYGPWVLW
jgi:hypothetical protein